MCTLGFVNLYRAKIEMSRVAVEVARQLGWGMRGVATAGSSSAQLIRRMGESLWSQRGVG